MLEFKRLLEFLKSKLKGELYSLVTPPSGTTYTKFYGYRVTGGLNDVSGLALNERRDIERKRFSEYFSSGLKLEEAESKIEGLKSNDPIKLVGSLCFTSPLYYYSKLEKIEPIDKFKVDWFLGFINLLNESIFFFLDFTINNLRVVYRFSAYDKQYFSKSDSDEAGISFLKDFTSFLIKVKKFKSENQVVKWCKITGINGSHVVLWSSVDGGLHCEIP